MNIIFQIRIVTRNLTKSTLFILILSIVILFTGCKTHKNVSRISYEKAKTLRDSAYKYALASINPQKSDLYYDSLFMSKYVKKRDYYNAGQVAATLGKYSKSIAIWSKMRKVTNDDEYDYSYWLPNLISPGYEYYEGLIHAKGFKKLWSHYPDFPLVHNLSNQDSSLVKKIKAMYALDQRVRHRYIDSPSVQNNYLWTVCDSANAITLDSIILNKGVITTNEFGNLVSRDFVSCLIIYQKN